MNQIYLIKLFAMISIATTSVSCFFDHFPKKLPKLPKFPDFRAFPNFWGTQLELWNDPSFNDKPELDHFVFVLTWPITPYWGHSRTQINTHKDASWVIRGLWPEVEGYDEPSPMHCSEEETFDEKDLASIASDLKKAWPGWDGREAESTWELAWNTFGTCAVEGSNMTSSFDYFNTSLQLYNKFPVYDWLADQDIVPDQSRMLSQMQIEGAIYNKTEAIPYLRCTNEHHWQYLQSIMICIDLELNPINCTHWNAESHDYICRPGEGIFYPQYSPDHF